MRARPGVILLEVIVSLAIVAVASMTYLALARQNADAVQRSAMSEMRQRSASDFIATVTLWPTADLDRRLGDRRQGPWTLRIHRESPRLYSIVLLDSIGSETLLETAVLRPGEPK